MGALLQLKAAKEKADKAQLDRANYAAYVADRKEHGGWTSEDVAEYRREVERIMKSGADDEKAAAREFLALKAAENSAIGINQRIRSSIAHARNEQGEAA